MLSIDTEHVVSLTEAAGLLPRRRQGKKPNVATLYRWASRGCRGIVLETIQIGGTRCTSREALQRFAERLTTAGGANSPSSPPPCNSAHDHADRTLKGAGW